MVATALNAADTFSIKRWENSVNQISKQDPLPDRGKDRLLAYLFDGQKEFSDQSAASIDPISLAIIQLFYPNLQGKIADQNSSALNQQIIQKLSQRFREEEKGLYLLPVPEKKELWNGEKPYHGQNVATWKPWFLTSSSEFRLPKPPEPNSPFWREQVAEIKTQMALANDAQKQRVLFWANKMSDSASGDWMAIIDQYMEDAKIPVSKQVAVHDTVSKAIVDATIAAFDTKYTYLVKRPFMVDPTLKPYIETPNHPSYPSAHSTVSSAIVEILNFYFPENQQEWERLREETGMSRIWGGIHFPIDHEGGKVLGKNVGQAVLSRSKKS